MVHDDDDVKLEERDCHNKFYEQFGVIKKVFETFSIALIFFLVV